MAAVHVRCTLTGHRYPSLLELSIILTLKSRQCDKTTVFMQDDALPHISRCLKQLLCCHFGDERIISRQFLTAWPPKSPQLESLQFLALEIPQAIVYHDPIHLYPTLKKA